MLIIVSENMFWFVMSLVIVIVMSLIIGVANKNISKGFHTIWPGQPLVLEN